MGLFDAREHPITDDNKPIVVMYPAQEGFTTFMTGRGDDVTNGNRGQGTQLHFDWTTGEIGTTKSVTLNFMEVVEVHDGRAIFGPTEAEWNSGDDWISFKAEMPATPYTDRTTEADGNANRVATGLGFNIIVPAADDGDTSIDIGDGTAADLGTAVPVPNSTNTGYWDADQRTGVITPNATGTGNMDLFDVQIEATMLNELPIGEGHRTFDIDVYKSEWLHPNWNLVLSAHKASAGAGWLRGWCFLFREKTQVP